MEAWMWIVLIVVAIIGVIANAARTKSDGNTIKYQQQQIEKYKQDAVYDTNGKRVR